MLKLPSISHTCFFDTKLYKPVPLFAVFFVRLQGRLISVRKQHVGSNTRSVLARFGDNNREKGEDFVKPFSVKNLVWEMEGSLSAHAGWLDHVAKNELRQNLVKVAKILRLSQKYSKKIRPSCKKDLSTSFCVCLVLWKQRNLEIRADIPQSCQACRKLVVCDKIVPCKYNTIQ